MEKPPIIERRRTSGIKLFVTVLLTALGLMLLLAYLVRPKRPRESELIKNFYAHRVAYEQLRDMLQTDKDVVRLASWGVETTNSLVVVHPSEGGFSADRYREYMTLLHQVGGLVASRRRGQPADPSIIVWAWGWAGNTRHIGICWKETEPTNQVASLDDYRGRRDPREWQFVYKHIDEKWYLWKDL